MEENPESCAFCVRHYQPVIRVGHVKCSEYSLDQVERDVIRKRMETKREEFGVRWRKVKGKHAVAKAKLVLRNEKYWNPLLFGLLFIFSYLVFLNLEFQSVANPRPSCPLVLSLPRRRVEERHKNGLTVQCRLSSRKRQTKKLDERFKSRTAAEKWKIQYETEGSKIAELLNHNSLSLSVYIHTYIHTYIYTHTNRHIYTRLEE